MAAPIRKNCGRLPCSSSGASGPRAGTALRRRSCPRRHPGPCGETSRGSQAESHHSCRQTLAIHQQGVSKFSLPTPIGRFSKRRISVRNFGL
eukprot:scaffold97054_cov40-Prasinocladus_malaysianus.AAC.1